MAAFVCGYGNLFDNWIDRVKGYNILGLHRSFGMYSIIVSVIINFIAGIFLYYEIIWIIFTFSPWNVLLSYHIKCIPVLLCVDCIIIYREKNVLPYFMAAFICIYCVCNGS